MSDAFGLRKLHFKLAVFVVSGIDHCTLVFLRHELSESVDLRLPGLVRLWIRFPSANHSFFPPLFRDFFLQLLLVSVADD
jgi:hypothetical protein